MRLVWRKQVARLYSTRAHPAIRHCSYLLLKCGVATNIRLKLHSCGFKNYIFAKKCILISFWIFQYCSYYSFTLFYCAIFYSLNTGFFNTITVSNSLDPDQTRHFVGPDLGPNCLQRLSADNKSRPLAGKEFNTKQLVDTTFWLKPWLKLISFGSNFFYLAKVLATPNSEPV